MSLFLRQGSTDSKDKPQVSIPVPKTPTSMKSEDHVWCDNIGVGMK